MKHPGQDYLRPEAANQAEKPVAARPYSGRSERVDGNAGWKKIRRDAGLRDQAEMELILLARKGLSEQGKHLLGSSAAKMRDEQQDSRTVNHQVFQ
jgi:hypothetical protein